MVERLASQKATRFTTLLNLGTSAFILAWLAVACYALAYLISH
jgi:hypothetical protein